MIDSINKRSNWLKNIETPTKLEQNQIDRNTREEMRRRDQLTWSSRMARIMERAHSTAEVRQTRMTKQSNTRNKCMFFSAATHTACTWLRTNADHSRAFLYLWGQKLRSQLQIFTAMPSLSRRVLRRTLHARVCVCVCAVKSLKLPRSTYLTRRFSSPCMQSWKSPGFGIFSTFRCENCCQNLSRDRKQDRSVILTSDKCKSSVIIYYIPLKLKKGVKMYRNVEGVAVRQLP